MKELSQKPDYEMMWKVECELNTKLQEQNKNLETEIKALKERLDEYLKLAKLGVYSVEGLINYNHESWELSTESWLLKTKTLLEKQKRETLSKDEK